MEDSNYEVQTNEYVGKSLFDFISITVKYRKFLFLFIFCITLLTIIFALLSPKWYKSRTSVFPADKTDLLGDLGGLSSLVKTFSPTKGLAGLTGPTETDRYLAILKSGTVLDKIIRKFDLVNVYEISDGSMEKTVKALLSNVEFEVQDEGYLTIDVFDKNPQRAADMANYFVDQLNEVNAELNVKNATANRMFIEKRYEQNLKDISDLESSMKEFQKKYGVVAVPEQIEATVKTMAEVYGKLAEKEIEMNVLQRAFSNDHPLYRSAAIEVQELQKKINQLNRGSQRVEGDINVLIPFKKAPELGAEYLKIYRNLEIQYKILQFVTPLYEQAKVEEVRNTPSVLVLDKASPAERKAKPKISLYAILSFLFSIIVGYVIVFSKEMTDKYKTRYPSGFNYIISEIKSDLQKIRFRKKG